MDALRRAPVVRTRGVIDVGEDAGIAIDHGKPAALHLDHDPVPLAERVVAVAQIELDPCHSTRYHRAGGFIALAVLRTHHLPRHQHLEMSHAGARRIGRVVGHVAGKDVDQLHDPVGVGAAGGGLERGDDRSDDRHVLGERLALVDQHVRAARGEPLILDHPQVALRGPHLGAEWHRLPWIVHELVIARTAGRRERETPARMKVEHPRLGRLRRPTVVRPPRVAAGLEHRRLGWRFGAQVLEVALEERELDFRLEVPAGGGAEPDVAQLVAGHAAPSAVEPRSHRKDAPVLRVNLFELIVDAHRPVEVLGIEPPGHVQDRQIAWYRLQVLEDVLRLPVRVVVRMLHEVVPRRHLTMEVQRVDACRRAGFHEEPVSIGRAVVEGAAARGGLAAARAGVAGEPAERVHEPERAVVVEVVADEHVRRRRLRRRGLERGMRLHHRHHGLPRRIRDAPHADPAGVARDVPEHPLDRVVRIRALVDVLRGALHRLEGTHHLELALRAEFPAHVLKDEDVAVAVELLRRAEWCAVGVRLVGSDRVGRTEEDDRVAARRIARRVDDGVEPHAVAHGYHVLLLDVVRFHVEHCVLLGLRARGVRGGRCEDQQRSQEARRRAG